MAGEPVDSFRASPSLGWLWVLALTALMVAPWPPALLGGAPVPAEERSIVLAVLAVEAVIIVWFLVTIVCFPRMRYDLAPETLVIAYGPILRYTVAYSTITDVRAVDLRFSPWSSFRFPGLALWKVQYGAGMGVVKMCSTRSHRGVLLITAGGERYGISPAEQERFTHELASRIERASRAARD